MSVKEEDDDDDDGRTRTADGCGDGRNCPLTEHGREHGGTERGSGAVITRVNAIKRVHERRRRCGAAAVRLLSFMFLSFEFAAAAFDHGLSCGAMVGLS